MECALKAVMHALIIEDNSLIGVLLEDELREIGYDSFDLVQREDEAVVAAAARCPDLITADDRLIEGSGISAVKRICENLVIPVVLIVGSPQGAPLPFAAVVAKPFERSALLAAIGEAVLLARRHSSRL